MSVGRRRVSISPPRKQTGLPEIRVYWFSNYVLSHRGKNNKNCVLIDIKLKAKQIEGVTSKSNFIMNTDVISDPVSYTHMIPGFVLFQKAIFTAALLPQPEQFIIADAGEDVNALLRAVFHPLFPACVDAALDRIGK